MEIQLVLDLFLTLILSLLIFLTTSTLTLTFTLILLSHQNLLCTPDLISYDTFELIIQELDLKLEQQIVLASWDFLKDFLQERRVTEGKCFKFGLKLEFWLGLVLCL
jgi:hypothetical protein